MSEAHSEDQEEGVPNDVSHEIWRKLKKNRTTIAVYTVSAAISVGVILTQQKVITNMNHEKQEMSDNIQHLEQKIENIQHSMNENLEKLEKIETNTTDNNASNGFFQSFAGTTVALAARVVVGAVFGV